MILSNFKNFKKKENLLKLKSPTKEGREVFYVPVFNKGKQIEPQKMKKELLQVKVSKKKGIFPFLKVLEKKVE